VRRVACSAVAWTFSSFEATTTCAAAPARRPLTSPLQASLKRSAVSDMRPMSVQITPASSRLRPPLKWAGGKRWQVSYVQPLWQRSRSRRLVEPFCGGLAMVLGLSPASALLNDINPHLINFYAWLRRGLTISFPMANVSSRYYALRRRFNELLDAGHSGTDEAAGICYSLNRTVYTR